MAFESRTLEKNNKIADCWTSYGKVMIKDLTNTVKEVKSLSDLLKIHNLVCNPYVTIYRSCKLLHFHKYCTPSQAHISNLQIATSPCYPRYTLAHMHSLHRFIYVCLILHFILFSHSRNCRSVQTTEASLHVNVVHVMPTLRSTETKYVKPTIIVYRLDIILLLKEIGTINAISA